MLRPDGLTHVIPTHEDPVSRVLFPPMLTCFKQDGIVFPISVLTPGETRFYRQACDELERQLGGKPRTVEVRQMHLHFRWAFELASHPRVLDAVEELLGPDLVIWATELFAKHPHDAAVSIGWHRDRTYLEFDPRFTVTAWIALSDCNLDNGCLCVVLERERERATAWQTQRGRRDDRENRHPDVPPEAITPVILKPGQMSLHDAHILHGSGPNRSAEKRVGFAVRYVTPQAQPRTPRPPAILARGNDRFGRFAFVAPPDDIDYQLALPAMRRSARAHLEAALENVKHSAQAMQ